MKKKIYMLQINYLHGKTTFLPYTVGTLIASAVSHEDLNAYYSFEEPLFIREDTDILLERITEPYMVCFSNYIWNHEYNKCAAKKIKERYPECLIVFGGHQITPDSALLAEEPYIDIMMFGEGEESIVALLRSLKNGTDLSCVHNIAFRTSEGITETEKSAPTGIDYPSPYLTGVFDSIFEHYPNLNFHAILETNRGCPYNCAYCDWGNLQCRVRFFPEEKIINELRWFSEHNISGFGAADANFGMFERDEKFVDEMIRLHREEGVLTGFQASYAKNSNDRVFSITKKLNDCGMNKGATLSFQSLSEDVLANINRKNISVDTFASLLNKYNEAGIATYTELILGLPGETYGSFVDGIDILLDSGQHNSIYIHDCEWLPCSAMGDREYSRKYRLGTVRVPLNQPHRVMEEDEIPEFSNLVISTDTMEPEDWINMNIYSAVIQCFHHEGLLMLFALYLHNEKNMKFSDFYRAFIANMFSRPETVGGKVLASLRNRLTEVTQGRNGLVWEDRRFGDVGWPSEEYVFLSTVYEFDRFYDEIKDFLSSFFDDKALFEDLFGYQKNVVKLPAKDRIDFISEHDFKSYFSDILCGKDAVLRKAKCRNTVSSPVPYKTWRDYARFIVWYGRKDSRNIYLDEIELSEN